VVGRIHDKLGTAGFVIAIVALVAALGGAAIAAMPGLNAKQKKQVTKIAKKYAGQPGPAGPAGPQGPPGAKGADGKNGAPGATGVDGKSVTVKAEGPGANCADGGSAFEVEGSGNKRYICNGASATGPLKTGETETGVWSFSSGPGDLNPYAQVSFPRQLPTTPELETGWVETDNNEHEDFCTGSVEEPKAAPGWFCVYEKELTGTSAGFPLFRSVDHRASGYILEFEAEAPNASRGYGSWAVTAP
jgi:hypothetical protein